MTTACITAAAVPASGAGCLSARCSGATAAIARPRLPVQDPVDLAPDLAAPALNRARAALAAAVVEAASAAEAAALAEVHAAEASAAVADKIRNRHFLFWECRFFEKFFLIELLHAGHTTPANQKGGLYYGSCKQGN